MKRISMLLVLVMVVILSACSPKAPTPDPAFLSLQTELANLQGQNSILQAQKDDLVKLETQYALLQSATPKLLIREVTQTYTPTPLYTPTMTLTPTMTSSPTITSSPTKTPDPLKMPKGNGFYLIGIDIAPGVWRSDGTGDGCYWSVTAMDGDIFDNHFGMAGGTAFISPNGFQVEFNDCGTWTFLRDP